MFGAALCGGVIGVIVGIFIGIYYGVSEYKRNHNIND